MSVEQLSPEADVTACTDEITLNYNRLKDTDQTRDDKGKLVDPVAQTFEARMNRELDRYIDVACFAAQAALLEAPDGA